MSQQTQGFFRLRTQRPGELPAGAAVLGEAPQECWRRAACFLFSSLITSQELGFSDNISTPGSVEASVFSVSMSKRCIWNCPKTRQVNVGGDLPFN